MASNNNWLQLMAVLRVEEAEAATYHDIFTRASNQIKNIKETDHVRWQSLMQILLSWVYWRRPAVERPALLAEAERAQASVQRKGEIRTMANKLGPSFYDLAKEEALEVARKEVREMVKDEVRKEVREEVREEEQLLALRDMLKSWLQDKFGRLPKKLQKQIDSTANAEQLRQAIRQVPECAALADFQL